MDICMRITESLCCTPETQHCKSTVLQYKIKIFLKRVYILTLHSVDLIWILMQTHPGVRQWVVRGQC